MDWKYHLIAVWYFLCHFQASVDTGCSDNVNKTENIKPGYYKHGFWRDTYVPPAVISRTVNSIYTTCESVNLPLVYRSNWNCRDCPRTLKIISPDLPLIPSGAFRDVSSVTILILNNLNISKLMPNGFEGHFFKEIDLSGNKLREISTGIFNGLTELEILNLSDNHLESISSNSFVGARKLKSLNLHYNYLSNFSINILDPGIKMEMLDISKNRISKLVVKNDINIVKVVVSSNLNSQVDFCPFIFTELTLNNNLINSVNAEHCNKSTYKITRLYLSNNNISKLETYLFEKAPELNELYLDNNRISVIPTGTFYNLNKLTHLNLSCNNLKKFDHGTFDNLIELVTLDLSHNKIESLNILHSLKSLEKLYIENNRINILDSQQIYYSSPYLQRIWFQNNNLTCENIIKIIQYFRDRSVNIGENNVRNVSNIHGIACTNNLTAENQIEKRLQILNSNLGNITSILSEINNQGIQLKSELKEITSQNEEIKSNFNGLVQYYKDSKLEDSKTFKFGLENITSLLKQTSEKNAEFKRELNQIIGDNNQINHNISENFHNMTDMKFKFMKSSLKNITSFFNELSEQNNNLKNNFTREFAKFIQYNDSRKDSANRNLEFIKFNLENLQSEFRNFFEEFNNSKELDLQNKPEFEKLISSEDIEKFQSDKILIVLGINFILMIVICSVVCLFVFKYLWKKTTGIHEQVELLQT